MCALSFLLASTAFSCLFVRCFMGDALLRSFCGLWVSPFWIAACLVVAAAVYRKRATLPSQERLQALFDYVSTTSKAVLLVGIVGVVIPFLLSSYQGLCMVPKVENAFLSGAPNVTLHPCYQNRTAELPSSLLHPAASTGDYYLVKGPTAAVKLPSSLTPASLLVPGSCTSLCRKQHRISESTSPN